MRLNNVRIRCFRSIESEDVAFGDTTILFGKNDSGKTNILKALQFAFSRSRLLDQADVHVSPAHPDAKETVVSVDLRFSIDEGASPSWLLYLGAEAVNIEVDGKVSFCFRTEAKYNAESRSFEKARYLINDWANFDAKGNTLPPRLLDAFDFILLDAHRDMAELVRDRRSRWNQELVKADIPIEQAEEMKARLSELGSSIVDASEFLTRAQANLKGATDHPANKVEIMPVARDMSELYRSLDILVTEDDGPSISLAEFGSGTRSRAEFMAYCTLIDIAQQTAELQGIPYYCFAAFEEPEAHVHPQSQQQLLAQLGEMGVQRIVTTHSPYLLAKAPLDSLVHVKRQAFATVCTRMNIELTKEQEKETERYLLRSRGELLFADVVILAEGETEEQALPIFFERHYGKKPFEKGVAIVATNGVRYEPYLRIAIKLGIPWLILSDAENVTLSKVEKQIGAAIGVGGRVDLKEYPQVITCRPNNDYEQDLIDDGYSEEMISAINATESAFGEGAANPSTPHFERWKQNKDGQSKGKHKTGETCSTCNRPIFEEERYDYSGENGTLRALEDFMNEGRHKTRYAAAIAEGIANLEDERCLPTCVKSLFGQLDKVLPEYGDA